ncbi:MAG: hypothetical protein AB8B55_20340 [Mariniblastus sp.]
MSGGNGFNSNVEQPTVPPTGGRSDDATIPPLSDASSPGSINSSDNFPHVENYELIEELGRGDWLANSRLRTRQRLRLF